MTSVPSISPTQSYSFGSVSCAGLSFCTAVGGNANVNVVQIWNGSAWAVASVPTPTGGGNLLGVSCFSATSCTAVGDAGASLNTPQALTFDGQTWTESTVPTGPPSSTADYYVADDCLTDWACVAVGLAKTSSTTALPLEAMAPIARSGYRFVASDGGIFNYGPSSGGGAPFLGSMGGSPLNAPIVGMATMPAGDGYDLVASDGGVFNFGSARFFGSTGSIHLNKPVVGMAVTPDGGGYWLVASDGGVFNYGDAPFYGSMGGQPLNKPIVGIAATPNGNGYYEVASDGGIFTFPTGAFRTSLPGLDGFPDPEQAGGGHGRHSGWSVLPRRVRRRDLLVPDGPEWTPLLRFDGRDKAQPAGRRHDDHRRRRRLLPRGGRRRHLQLPNGSRRTAVLRLAWRTAPQRADRGHRRVAPSRQGQPGAAG